MEPNIKEEIYEENTKLSFYDDAVSNESRKEKVDYEIKNNKNEQIKKEIKINDLNNEMESVIIINYKKRKSTNLDDTYCSLKLPKFINVCSAIKKKKKKKDKNEKEEKEKENEEYENESDIEYFNKNKSSIILWSFDEDRYNKIKFEKNKRDENLNKLFFGDNNNLKNNNDKDYIENNINTTERKTPVNGEKENLEKGENEDKINKVFNNVNEETVDKITNKVKNEEENLNSFSSALNKVYKTKREYSTDNESNFNDDMSDISDLEDLYEKYEIENSEIMSISSNESNENVKNVCNNLKYLETNSFIVEYEDGKFIFFINQKPYILEEDNEINYLIESTEENIKPIHCKLEKKFFIKSIATEEQIIPTNLKMNKDDIYYSLAGIEIDEEVEKQ